MKVPDLSEPIDQFDEVIAEHGEAAQTAAAGIMEDAECNANLSKHKQNLEEGAKNVIKRLDHIGVIVPLQDFKDTWGFLGFDLLQSLQGHVAEYKCTCLFIPHKNIDVEFVIPDADSGLQKYLRNQGQGLHHIAFEVDSLKEETARLKDLGLEFVSENVRGAKPGMIVSFLNRIEAEGVLVELVEYTS
jgi:methylmalonyl-CoA/ethylmalonyl-CoA epimerase